MENYIFFIEITGVIVRQQEIVFTIYIVSSCLHIQKISQSVIIAPDFAVHIFCRELEINTIDEYQIPDHVSDKNTLEMLIGNMKK